MSAIFAAIASGFAIAGAVFAVILWVFKLASDVAVLKAQMGEVKPVEIAKDISYIKGAIVMLAHGLNVTLAGDEE